MKRLICVIISIGILLVACGEEKSINVNEENNIESKKQEDNVTTDIKNYMNSNVGYDCDLKVVKEDNESYAITACLPMSYALEELVPFAQKLMELSKTVEEKYNISIKYINPAIYMSEDTWIGWSNNTGNFYDQDEFISKNVSLEELENEVKKYKNKNKKIDKEESPEELKERFGDKLEPFQGEWKNIKLDNRLIISGKTVNSVHYDIFDERKVSDVFTFYFDLDESGNLIVSNEYAQPRFTMTIDENSQLIKKDIHDSSDEDDIYKKVSDNKSIPNVPIEPSIGMTESEVYASTWGAPKKINETITAGGKREQWVYDKGYIYFENGYVTAIQK